MLTTSWELVGERALVHLALSAAALAIALAAATALAALARPRPALATFLRSLSATFVVVPAIGLLAGLATLWPASFGPTALAILAASLVALGTVLPVLLAPGGKLLRGAGAVRRGLSFAIGVVALAAFTDGPGLGRFLVEGITAADPALLIAGGLSLAGLAVALDILVGAVAKGAARQRAGGTA